MKSEVSAVVDPQCLVNLQESSLLVIVDASSGPNAKSNYDRKHLEGALYVDPETALAEVPADAAQGGRHPLPSVDAFCRTLGALGISPTTHVVIYDSLSGGNAAARLWWMLKALGHEKVQLLNGGLSHAEANGFPVSDTPVKANPTDPYPAEKWLLPIADMEEVANAAASDGRTVIDVRSGPRYAGEVEPIDLIAGHIPGAINIPFEENLNSEGLFLSPDALREKYANIFEHQSSGDVIVHCGSGITACHTLLAMEYAGYGIPKLYVGSWSEWSRNDRPMITKSY